MSEQVNVDLEVLQRFRTTLDLRLVQLQDVSNRLAWLGHHRPEFGQFAEAHSAIEWYDRLHREHTAKVERLRQALVATQQTTDTIIAAYADTEQNNAARMAAITQMLPAITEAIVGNVGRAVEDTATVVTNAVTDVMKGF